MRFVFSLQTDQLETLALAAKSIHGQTRFVDSDSQVSATVKKIAQPDDSKHDRHHKPCSLVHFGLHTT